MFNFSSSIYVLWEYHSRRHSWINFWITSLKRIHIYTSPLNKTRSIISVAISRELSMSIKQQFLQFSTIFLIISQVISLNSTNKPKKTLTMKVYIKFIKIYIIFSKRCCTLCASDSVQCPIKIFSKNSNRFSVKPALI